MGQGDQPRRMSVACEVRARIPYPGGSFYLHLYTNSADGKEHLALVFGDAIKSASLERVVAGETAEQRAIRGASAQGPQHTALAGPPIVRLHSECYTGETVSSTRCDCGAQLAQAMQLMGSRGCGVVIYLRQEGRNIGLRDKLKAYNLQDLGHDTVSANLLLNHPPDARSYDAAHLILQDLAISRLVLLTNNPDKIATLQSAGIDVVERLPMLPSWWLDRNSADHYESPHGLEAPPKHQDSPTHPANPQQDRLLPDSSRKTRSASPHVFSSFERHLHPSRAAMAEADKYLLTKALKMGHLLDIPK